MRNLFHYLIMFTLSYLIGSWCDFAHYTLDGKIIAPFCLAIVGGVLGGFWEWMQAVVLKAEADKMDVLRGALGAFIGAVVSVFLPNILWLKIGLAVISGFILICEAVIIGKLLHNRWKSQ